MKLWAGRFNKNTAQTVENFTASIAFDYRLAEVDILGSIAHATMLGECKILTADEVQGIITGLQTIRKKIASHELEFSIADEDIHTNIERHLYQEIGALAGKLHTGRSRNDQVALDLHLYLREHVLILIEKIRQLQSVLVTKASEHLETWLPGYTHLQRAQPVSLAHHLLAYFWMLQRDIERLIASWPRLNLMPLGAGALAGSSFPLDRELTARLLGFSGVYENSMDAVSDRDFVVEFQADAALIMMHLSRLSEELILWSSREFGFIELDDAYCTGSSMMPQKKNPDVPELIRAKTGRVYGALTAILTVLKALPLCYNKDLQEDKEPLFDTLHTLLQSLELLAPLLSSMKIHSQVMQAALADGFINATQLADYLVEKGLPFREAHAVVGKLVQHCIQQNCALGDLPLEILQKYAGEINSEVYPLLSVKNIGINYKTHGSTAPSAIKFQIQQALRKLRISERWLAKSGQDNPLPNQMMLNSCKLGTMVNQTHKKEKRDAEHYSTRCHQKGA